MTNYGYNIGHATVYFVCSFVIYYWQMFKKINFVLVPPIYILLNKKNNFQKYFYKHNFVIDFISFSLFDFINSIDFIDFTEFFDFIKFIEFINFIDFLHLYENKPGQ